MAIETATNPKTGEQAAFVDGKWLPITETATNAEGKKAYLIGGKWLSDEPAAPPAPEPVASEGWPSRHCHGLCCRLRLS